MELVFLGLVILRLVVSLHAVVKVFRILHGQQMRVVFFLVGLCCCSADT